MNIRISVSLKWMASIALALSLGSCGGIEEGFEDLADLIDSDDKSPSPHPKNPSRKPPSSGGGGGAAQRPESERIDFVGNWQTLALLIATDWGKEPSQSPLTGTSPLLDAGNGWIAYRIGECNYPAQISGKLARFEAGVRCYERNQQGYLIEYTVEKGEMEWMHTDHLYFMLRLNWQTTELSTSVGGTLVLVGELTRNGHPTSSEEE